MCNRRSRSLLRRDCTLLIFAAFFLLYGSCQNAGPEGLFGESDLKENEHRRDDSYDADTTDQRFKWVESEGDRGSFDEHVAPGSSPPADTEGETKTETPRSYGNNNDKAEMSELADGDYVESTRQSSLTRSFRCKSARGTKRRLCSNESTLRSRRRYTSGGRRATSATRLSASNRIRGSSSRNWRIQDRGQTRAKKRGRKRNGKRIKDQGNRGKIRSRKSKSGGTSAEAPTANHRASNEEIQNSGETLQRCSSKDCPLNETAAVPAGRGTNGEPEARGGEFYAGKDVDSDNTVLPRITESPEEVEGHRKLYGRYDENVEREFSKNLEMEILSSRTERPRDRNKTLSTDGGDESSSLNGPKTELPASAAEEINAGFDAAKMLGYSRSSEDLPIIDLENEVLARTLNDYNAYLKTGGKSAKLGPRARNSQDHLKNVPIPVRPSYGNDSDKKERRKKKQQRETDALEGDLTCINGTFLPAPLSQHALIKYIKSSTPGHEYLEADYECIPGYYIASSNSRLFCKDHQWVGELPNCKIRHGQSGSCGEFSCDQVCNEVDGEAKCSCYNGFHVNGHKCIDINECDRGNGGCEHICVNTPGSYRCECPQGMKRGEDEFSCMDVNECLLNNGHGPCQDTCRNLEGSYACSCEGLPGTTLSPNNHTCQDAGPCAINNAGCSHTCLSTMGRVFCLCPDGFMLDDDWKTCQDIDECSVPDLETVICQYGCINTPGSYRCIDPTGELVDQMVQDSPSIICLPGFQLSAESNCVDINECAINNGECSEVCENTEGSFFCACDGDERALGADGKSCTDINNLECPPLDPASRGYLVCSRETIPRLWRGVRRAANRPGTKCYLKCPSGYQLHGEYELTCQGDGTWDGPKHGECVKYSKPRLECPKDVVAEIAPNRDEAFVTFDQPSTDLDWFRYVRSKPPWGTRLEASLKPGLHLVTFFARHPVSKTQASCVLRIIIKEGEAPKVNDCPASIVGKNGTSFTWSEPTFTDNVGVTHTSKNESPGKVFGIGEWKIVYEASDEAGWTTRCAFSVVVHQD